MDLRLPDMDGAEVARRLAERRANRADPGRRAELVAAAGERRLARERPASPATSRSRSASGLRRPGAPLLRSNQGMTVHPTVASPRGVAIRGVHYPVVLPSLRDPRLHLAAVIISLQILGQVRVPLPSLDRTDCDRGRGRARCSKSPSSCDDSRPSSGQRARYSPATASRSSCACRAPSTGTGGARTAGGSSREPPPSRCSRSIFEGPGAADAGRRQVSRRSDVARRGGGVPGDRRAVGVELQRELRRHVADVDAQRIVGVSLEEVRGDLVDRARRVYVADPPSGLMVTSTRRQVRDVGHGQHVRVVQVRDRVEGLPAGAEAQRERSVSCDPSKCADLKPLSRKSRPSASPTL